MLLDGHHSVYPYESKLTSIFATGEQLVRMSRTQGRSILRLSPRKAPTRVQVAIMLSVEVVIVKRDARRWHVPLRVLAAREEILALLVIPVVQDVHQLAVVEVVEVVEAEEAEVDVVVAAAAAVAVKHNMHRPYFNREDE